MGREAGGEGAEVEAGDGEGDGALAIDGGAGAVNGCAFVVGRGVIRGREARGGAVGGADAGDGAGEAGEGAGGDEHALAG